MIFRDIDGIKTFLEVHNLDDWGAIRIAIDDGYLSIFDMPKQDALALAEEIKRIAEGIEE